VGFQVLTAANMKFRVFWDVALCSHVEVDRRFKGAYCLHHQGDEFTALMMEAVRTCETSSNFNVTTWLYITEDSKLRAQKDVDCTCEITPTSIHPITIYPSYVQLSTYYVQLLGHPVACASVSVSNCIFFISPVVVHTQTDKFWQAVLRFDESRMLYYVTFSVILRQFTGESSAKQLTFMSKLGIQFRDCCDFPRLSSVF
jgi:uncharacterized membrane protein (DUF485 family)